jgi:hypothetical protein
MMCTNDRSGAGRRRRTPRLAAAIAALALAGAALPARAQLRLPAVGVPALSRLPTGPVTDTLQQALPLDELRPITERDLLRRHADRVEPDPAGHPVRRGELLWLDPSVRALAAALAQGFTVLRRQDLPELGLAELVLHPPAGVPLADAAGRLRSLEPDTAVDFNHLYLPGGETGHGEAAASAPARTLPRRVGMIDGGIDSGHDAFAHSRIHAFGCDGRERASAHGTAVASLLVGRDGAFAGVQPAADLYAADVYCGQPDGAAAEDVARALAWLVRERVPVINVSLVGPANALLEKAARATMRQGTLLVAAVGNDGPAAPPMYPASYPGVVGVTGVSPNRHALPEAAQGPQVSVAAPGADVAVAGAGGGYVAARGTSFAAPIVAGLLAQDLAQPDPQAAAAALARLEQGALDLGAPGRDDVFGFGLVGEAARTPPERVAARRR